MVLAYGTKKNNFFHPQLLTIPHSAVLALVISTLLIPLIENSDYSIFYALAVEIFLFLCYLIYYG
jgi:hypothetical protein